MTREELRDYVDEQRTLNNIPYHVYSALIDGIDTLEQEPFINKSCVSEKACEHDKNKVLNKIRADIENDWQLKKYPSSPFSCGLRRAIEIIDKYKIESEEVI